MDNQLKQEFTRRLSQCNAGGMIVITYDIFFAYLEDVKKSWNVQDREEYKNAIRKSQRTLDELIGALDMGYEIAQTLYPIYRYCKEELAKVMYENRLERLEVVEDIMRRLYTSFVKAAEQDNSAPIMGNAQQVYAGMTYGRSSLNESLMNDDQRGFLA